MPKKTIKSLEAEIATLRELRKGDERNAVRLENDRGSMAHTMNQLKAENEDLKRDKQWLKQMIQHLVAPQKDRL